MERDFIDTANEDWQQWLGEAQRHHGQANYYTRFRIKRSHDGLWRMGAAIGPLRPGYRRYKQNPDSPKSPKFDEIDPQWMTTIFEAFEMMPSTRLAINGDSPRSSHFHRPQFLSKRFPNCISVSQSPFQHFACKNDWKAL